MAIGATSALQPAAGNAAGKTKDAEKNDAYEKNFKTYIRLLTESIKYQDPEKPMTAQELSKQMIDLSSLELQTKQNDLLTEVRDYSRTQQSIQALGFLGSRVRMEGSEARSDGNGATWHLKASQAADDAEVRVLDKAGSVVFRDKYPLKSGANTYHWNGKTTSGHKAVAGSYRLEVSATGANKKTVNIDMFVNGIVEGIDLSQSEPILKLLGREIALSKVKHVERAQ